MILYSQKSFGQIIKSETLKGEKLKKGKIVIGLTGGAGSGKTTAADALAEIGFTRVAIADPLKRMAVKYFRIPAEEISDGHKSRYGRDILQGLGDLLAAIDPMYLVTRALGKIEQAQGNVVVADVRLQEEAKLIRLYGGTLVRLQCAGAPQELTERQQKHRTETETQKVEDDIFLKVEYGHADELKEKIKLIAYKLISDRDAIEAGS